jgi:radical SAM superfamily enzyme YgiQ (UPF0313 family)
MAFMPPQGILTVAAYAARRFEVRVVDENATPLTASDLDWADAVFVSGMHPHKRRMADIAKAAHKFGKLAVAGGPSVSGCPRYHPDFDVLHIGELGDATDVLLQMIETSVERPQKQIVLRTKVKLPIEDFPIPAYDKIDLTRYMVLSIQWSSGCPFTCEFCDIPELYGRNPRFKSAERLTRELEVIMKQQPMGAIWFVDDNLIGNRRAAKALMPHLIDWQKRSGYQMRLAGEASIDLAGEEGLLELMREAYFTDLFFGIESADRDTLAAISKKQNIRKPLLESVKKINEHGIELSSGIIFGFDSDGPDTAEKAIAFVNETQIPIIVFNLLYALPSTPLWRRLEKEGRLLPDSEADETNIRFKLPNEQVAEMYRRAVDVLYEPKSLYERFRYNANYTYPNRKDLPLSRFPLTSPAVQFGLRSMGRVLWKLGTRGDYRMEFWKLALELFKTGSLDHLVYAGAMGHHFIQFREDILHGRVRLSTFSHREGEHAPSLAAA